MVLTQTNATGDKKDLSKLRHHYIKVALFDENASVFKIDDVILNKDQLETHFDVSRVFSVAAVLPNYQDLAFIKLRLDQKSSSFFKDNFFAIKEQDDLAKGIIIRAFYDNCMDAVTKSTEFLDFMISIVSLDSGHTIVDMALSYISSILRATESDIHMGINAPTTYLPKKYHATYMSIVFQACYKRLQKEENPGIKISLVDRLITYATTTSEINILKDWLLGKNDLLKEYQLTIESQWKIVILLYSDNSFGEKEKAEIYNKVKENDTSDLKNDYELVIDSITADDQKRLTLLEEYFNHNTEMSFEKIRISISGFNHKVVSQEKKDKYYGTFYKRFPEYAKKTSSVYSRTVFEGLLPDSDNIEVILKNLREL